MNIEDLGTSGCYFTFTEDEKNVLHKALLYTKEHMKLGTVLGDVIDVIDNTSFIPDEPDNDSSSVTQYFPPLDRIQKKIHSTPQGKRTHLEGEDGAILKGLVNAVVEDIIQNFPNKENEFSNVERSQLAVIKEVFHNDSIKRAYATYSAPNLH